MKPVISLMSLILVCVAALGVDAQTEPLFVPGDHVLVVASVLPVYLQAEATGPVVEEMIPGMVSRVLGVETDSAGATWYYLQDNAYAWVQASLDGQSTLVAYSEAEINGLIDDASAVISADPDNADAYLTRGTAYSSLLEYERAFADYDAAVALAPDDGRYYDYRAKLALDAHRPDQALADAQTAIQLGRELANTYNRLGIAYQFLKRYEQARLAYTRAMTAAPTYGLLYNNRGNVYSLQPEPVAALQDYNMAVQYDPFQTTAYSNRALMNFRLGRVPDAMSDIESGLAVDPHCVNCRYVRGMIYDDVEQNYQAAIAEYTRALADDPNNLAVLARRGGSYIFLGRFADASADYERVLRRDPTRGDVQFNLAIAYARQNLYATSIDAYTAAMNLGCDPCAHFSLIHRAQVNVAAGHYDDAIIDSTTYINAYGYSENYALALMTAGAAYLYKKDYAEALNNYAFAATLPGLIEFVRDFETLGVHYRIINSRAPFIRVLKIAAAVGHFPETRYQLAVMEMEYGHWVDAKVDFKQYFRQIGQPMPDDLNAIFQWLLEFQGR